MLDAIGAGLTPRVGSRDWADVWRDSPEFREILQEIERIKAAGPRDFYLAPPDIQLPSAPSVMSSSTNSSKRSGKSLPRHVPKKLVMPAPLQPLQNQNQNQGPALGNIGSALSVYYPPPHSHSTPSTTSLLMPTSTHTHQQLHLSKSRKNQYGGLSTREMQVARASGYYPPPVSQSRSQHRQSPAIQSSLPLFRLKHQVSLPQKPSSDVSIDVG